MRSEKANWDKWGTWASALCAVHCVLTGFALGLLSIVGLGFIGSPLTEGLFILSALTLGSIALYHGHRKHRSIIPALIFILGLGLIALSHFAFEHGDPGAAILSILGGLSLIAFHIVNLKLQKGCGCTSCN